MKKLIIGLASLMVCAVAYGQGQVNFNNRVVGIVDAKVLLPDGTGAGAGFKAQLYGGPVGGALQPLMPVTDFRTGNAVGYVNGVTAIVPNVAAGGSATIVMRAFNGDTFETSSVFGSSEAITVSNLGGGTITPPNLVGLQGFSLIPEPSTIALGVLGVGALLFMRRRK
jgi:hypothetical protein